MMPADQLAQDKASAREHSSRTELAQQLERLNARIDQLERERDAAENFAALAAHELMAPLVMTEAVVAIVGDRLLDDPVDEELREVLAALGRGAGRTRLLVESLLHQARASAGPLRREPIDLGRLTRDCVALLQPEIDARCAEVIMEPLPEVRGEPELLGGLLTNLLVNALKFNPRQGGTIAITAQVEDGVCTISVESEGPAIPPEDRERIFEPFHRGHRERRVKGAGLGLAICRLIVERHGGQIGVTDAKVDGNRFFFTLPV